MSGYSLPSDAMNTSKSLDELIDTALHPERNGLLIKEQVAEGADHEWLVKRELKAAIVEAVEGLIGEDEPEIIFNKLLPGQPYIHNKGRNNLRAELRRAIKEWQDYGDSK